MSITSFELQASDRGAEIVEEEVQSLRLEAEEGDAEDDDVEGEKVEGPAALVDPNVREEEEGEGADGGRMLNVDEHESAVVEQENLVIADDLHVDHG